MRKRCTTRAVLHNPVVMMSNRRFTPINPRWFIGRLKETNGEQEYRHLVPLTAATPRAARAKLETKARNWYEKGVKVGAGEGWWHLSGKVYVESKSVIEVSEATYTELQTKGVL